MKNTTVAKGLVAIALPVLLAACAAPYSCQLGNECVNVSESYDAIRGGEGDSQGAIKTGDRKRIENTRLGKGAKNSSNSAGVSQAFRPYAGGQLDDKPVYIPPRPIRIWIAPWTNHKLDKKGDGYLMSGQFMYVTVGGKWNYGEMAERGQAGKRMLKPYMTPEVVEDAGETSDGQPVFMDSSDRVAPRRKVMGGR